MFTIEHECDVRGLGDVIRAWRQVDRLDRLFPYAGGLLSDENLPEPFRNSAKVEKIPWVEIDHSLSEQVFAISFLDFEDRGAGDVRESEQRTRSKSSMGRLDTWKHPIVFRRGEGERTGSKGGL